MVTRVESNGRATLGAGGQRAREPCLVPELPTVDPEAGDRVACLVEYVENSIRGGEAHRLDAVGREGADAVQAIPLHLECGHAVAGCVDRKEVLMVGSQEHRKLRRERIGDILPAQSVATSGNVA